MKYLGFISILLLFPVISVFGQLTPSLDPLSNVFNKIGYKSFLHLKSAILFKWIHIPLDYKIKVVSVIGDGMDTLDFATVTTQFNFIPNVDIKTVSNSKKPIKTQEGTTIVPDYTFDDEFVVDILSVPAGVGPTEELSKFLKKVYPKVQKYVFASCQGTEALAASGLLDGKKATTTKVFYSKIQSRYPKINWDKNARFTEDGKFITTSGSTAVLDGFFHMVSKVHNLDTATTVAQMNEYKWDPSHFNDKYSNNEITFPYHQVYLN